MFTGFCNVTLIKGQGPETLVNKDLNSVLFYLSIHVKYFQFKKVYNKGYHFSGVNLS